MPIRIYALAKQLKLDSKELADICTKAGVTGKGSALASLTDDETAKVTAFVNQLKGGRVAGHGPAPAREGGVAGSTGAFRREDYIAPAGAALGTKIPVLPGKSHEKPPLARKKPEAAPTGEPPLTAAPPPAVSVTAPPIAAPPVTPAAPPPVGADRADRGSPAPTAGGRAADRASGFIPSRVGEAAGERAGEGKEGQGEGQGEAGRAGTGRPRAVDQVAPLPVGGRVPPRPKAKEPAPQKPDLKLQPDAFRAGKAGTKPLSEHLRKAAEQRRRAEQGGTAAPAAAGAPAGAGLTPLPGASGPAAPGARGQRRRKKKARRPRSAAASKGN